MSQSNPAHSVADELYLTRKPRNQKRPNYVLDESTPTDSPLATPPPPKRPRTAPTERGNTSNRSTRGGTRPGAGRKTRATPNQPPRENTVPFPRGPSLAIAQPQTSTRTVLSERDNNVNGGHWGGIRDGAGRKQRAASNARNLNTTPRDIEPGNHLDQLHQRQSYNSHLRAHSPIQRDSAPVNPGIQVVMLQRESLPGSTFEEVPRPTSPEFMDVDVIAPDPRPDYAPRTRRYHARLERTNEDRASDQISRRRGPYRQRNGPTYQLCRDPDAAKAVELFTIHEGFRDESNTCPYCSAQSWPKERGNDNRWQCCDNGKNDWTPPDQSIKPEDVDGLPNGPEKERELCARDINLLLYEMDKIHVAGQPTKYRPTARCKEFMENIVSYNNCLSFTSEGTDKVDFNVGRTTFRIQGSVHHLIGPLMPDNGERAKFAQIYTLDGTQEQLDARQHYFNGLVQETLALAQRRLRSINPYIQGFKTCYDRLKEGEEQYPIETMSIRIHQLDPRRQDRGTHNRPISNEIARIMITPSDAYKGRIERDIRVETKEGGLMSIPEWHPSYMALRYILLFPFGEQSWHDRMPLAGQQLRIDHPLHASKRNRTTGTLSRHTMPAFDDNPEQEDHIDPEHEETLNCDGEGAPRGRGGSIRTTRRQFYVKWMQIRLKYFNRILHGGRLTSHWVTDTWASIEMNDLNWYRQNQQTIRADCYSGLMDRLSTVVTGS